MNFIRRHLVLIAALYMLIIPAASSYAISAIVGAHISDVQRTQVRVVQGQVTNGCHRLNVLRVGQTRNDLAVYKFFTVTADDLRLSARAPKAQRQATLAFADLLAGYANELSWTPLTNCNEAQKQGLAFRVPPSQPFHTRLPGSKNLALGPTN